VSGQLEVRFVEFSNASLPRFWPSCVAPGQSDPAHRLAAAPKNVPATPLLARTAPAAARLRGQGVAGASGAGRSWASSPPQCGAVPHKRAASSPSAGLALAGLDRFEDAGHSAHDVCSSRLPGVAYGSLPSPTGGMIANPPGVGFRERKTHSERREPRRSGGVVRASCHRCPCAWPSAKVKLADRLWYASGHWTIPPPLPGQCASRRLRSRPRAASSGRTPDWARREEVRQAQEPHCPWSQTHPRTPSNGSSPPCAPRRSWPPIRATLRSLGIGKRRRSWRIARAVPG